MNINLKVSSEEINDLMEDCVKYTDTIKASYGRLLNRLTNSEEYILCHSSEIIRKKSLLLETEMSAAIENLLLLSYNLLIIADEYERAERGNVDESYAIG